MKKYCTGEVILGSWSRRVETSSGTTDGYIKLFVPDDEILDILSRLSEDEFRGKRRDGGKLFRLTLEEYSDEPSFPPIPESNLKPSNLAALIGEDPLFPLFAQSIFSSMIELMKSSGIWKGTSKEKAASLIRFGCSVNSRSDLDITGPAQDLFFDVFYHPFLQYKREFKSEH